MAASGQSPYHGAMRVTREMKESRRRAMRDRAIELARSGDHSSYDTIALELRVEFGEDPHFLFEHPFDKERFNQICGRAMRQSDDDGV
jgi:hypothetical protein